MSVYLKKNGFIGLKVLEARYDGDRIYLIGENKTFELVPYGDCCANCFITDLDNTEALSGATITEFEDISIDSPDESDEVQVWGHRIHTDKGICTIGMRVEHNGYYGGSLNIGTLEDKTRALRADLIKDFS